MGWNLGINFPAYQQAEDCEKEFTFSSSMNPWSSPCMLFQFCMMDMGWLYFPFLGAERNVFGGFGIDY